eukprot:6587254-Prymnesium_polylepis.2
MWTRTGHGDLGRALTCYAQASITRVTGNHNEPKLHDLYFSVLGRTRRAPLVTREQRPSKPVSRVMMPVGAAHGHARLRLGDEALH